jgi:hypothetical protein
MVWFYGASATFNNISDILWRSVLLVGETGVPGVTHQPPASHWQTLSHTVVSSTPRLNGIRTNNGRGERHWLQTCAIYPTIIRPRWRPISISYTMFPIVSPLKEELTIRDYTLVQLRIDKYSNFWNTYLSKGFAHGRQPWHCWYIANNVLNNIHL